MDKKLKKKLLLERNKRQNIIFQHAEQHAKNTELLRQEEQQRFDSLHPATTTAEEEIWSAKVQDIRNKLTGKKRSARDRWNRYAGTSGGGGLGR